jgi:DNA-binding MarR family transcriptional regulator
MAAECLAGRIRILNRVVTGIYDDALRPHGVRISQLSILVEVAAAPRARATGVCRRLRLDKSTLSRDLERLVACKLIRVIPARGRAQDLEITDRGRALLRNVLATWEGAQSRAVELLGPELAKGLSVTVERLRAAGDDA